LAHDLFRKPVSTFRDQALLSVWRDQPVTPSPAWEVIAVASRKSIRTTRPEAPG
jgi:hypothetical protein